MKNNRSLLRFVCVSMLAVVGCGTQKAYVGDSLPSDQLATVVGHGVTLHRVNGIAIPTVATGAEVRPGPNEIELSVDRTNYNARNEEAPVFKLVLNAKPGTQYAITGQRGDGRLCAWPLSPETGDPDFQHPAGCISRE